MSLPLEKLEAIGQKCIAANPEVGELKAFECENCGSTDQDFYRPIRLADVLLAVHGVNNRPSYFNVACDGGFYEVSYSYPDDVTCVVEHKGLGGFYVGWNLREDDLTKQSPETLEFLYNLLNP